MNAQLESLLYQMMETEKGGVKIYTTALQCAINEDLKEEWTKYLEETRHHLEVVQEMFIQFNLDAQVIVPDAKIVSHIGESLVNAMNMAKQSGTPEAAQLVACECVVLAETKDHMNWELLSKCAEEAQGEEREILMAATDEVEDQEDEHLYHSKGWCRELWIQSLGMPAVLPPPEEEKHVKTAKEAAEAEKEREEML
ncbi:MAG: hypothetical protein ACYC4K_08890 [Thiobacillus sp.]